MVPWSNDVDRIKELVFSGLGPPPLTIEGVLAGQQAATLGQHRAEPSRVRTGFG
jgi:hypothetical protein